MTCLLVETLEDPATFLLVESVTPCVPVVPNPSTVLLTTAGVGLETEADVEIETDGTPLG